MYCSVRLASKRADRFFCARPPAITVQTVGLKFLPGCANHLIEFKFQFFKKIIQFESHLRKAQRICVGMREKS